jgi:hypothetical protein
MSSVDFKKKTAVELDWDSMLAQYDGKFVSPLKSPLRVSSRGVGGIDPPAGLPGGISPLKVAEQCRVSYSGGMGDLPPA